MSGVEAMTNGRGRRAGSRRAMPRAFLCFAGLCLVLTGCVGGSAAPDRRTHGTIRSPEVAPRPSKPRYIRPRVVRVTMADAAPRPHIVTPRQRLQCVPYARARSRIMIRGDAWTWWDSARGRYQRGQLPAAGAVLVLKRNRKGRGHLAVVTRILNDREIVVDHANWLNHGRIHKNARVRDVSRDNDWSQVKIWYTPGRQYGKRTYSPYGFIYPIELKQAALDTHPGRS